MSFEAQKAAQKYVKKLVKATEEKVTAQQQRELAIKEHEELLRYQTLCEEQRQLIETLRSQLAEKTEEAEEWRLKLEMTPSYQTELRKMQQQKEYDRKMRERPKPAAQIPPEDYDFWHTTIEEQEGEGREVKFEDIAKSKGLWIVSMEEAALGVEAKKDTSVTASPFGTTLKKTSALTGNVFQPSQTSQPTQPTQPGRKQLPKELPMRKDNFEAQRAKHQQTLGERMPLGRDGKRLPMPKPQPRRTNGNRSSDNMRRSGPLAGAGESVLGSTKSLKVKV
mmetsp:Transcript_14687/g.27216  ORF Transcript_14687/g.27216 Transcript_14687/m.27216 type:complete len:279 (-) Transcript_14687:1317-2153(-)